MTFSINSNAGALVALQNLSNTATQLGKVQNVISTGKMVNTAADDGAVWSIANTMTSKVSALDAVKDSLNRATSTVDVAMSAGQQVSDLLTQLKTKALAASDTSLNTTSLQAMNANFKSLLSQISDVVNNASFNGVNTQLNSINQSLNASLTSNVSSANQLLTQIATLNSQITSAQFNGGNATDLQSPRNTRSWPTFSATSPTTSESISAQPTRSFT